MSLIKKALTFTGNAVGKTAEIAIKSTGGAVALIAEYKGNEDLAKSSRKISKSVGEFVGVGVGVVGETLGSVADKTIEVSSNAGGAIAGSIAHMSGADQKQRQTVKKIGSIVGGAAVGFVTGEVIGSVLTGVTAATGIASTGAQISSLSGVAAHNATLAALGGGAIASGGGGMTAGRALLSCITASSTAIGMTDAVQKSMKDSKETKMIGTNHKIIEVYDYNIIDDETESTSNTLKD